MLEPKTCLFYFKVFQINAKVHNQIKHIRFGSLSERCAIFLHLNFVILFLIDWIIFHFLLDILLNGIFEKCLFITWYFIYEVMKILCGNDYSLILLNKIYQIQQPFAHLNLFYYILI